MTTPAADGMPTTRGLNFYLADPNLEFVCSTVMEAGHDGAFEPLAGFVQSRLDSVGEPAAKRWVDVVAGTLADLRRRVAARPGLDAADRELDARPVADALYHALAGAVLRAEGEALRPQRRSARKWLAGALYLKKWLRPPALPASVFAARECAWLPALVDWTPIPAEALAAEPGGGC